MPYRENAIARLKAVQNLLFEALRVTDEGPHELIGAKISDCMDCTATELAAVTLLPPVR